MMTLNQPPERSSAPTATSWAGRRDQAYSACADLRFAEGLRRRSAEARAEAAVQEAVGAAWLEGARTDPKSVRAEAMALSDSPATSVKAVVADPALAWAMGTWRAVWRGLDALPDLNARSPERMMSPPVPGMLAAMNRDVCSFLVASGQIDSSNVAIPQQPDSAVEVVRQVRGPGDAIDRAGRIWQVLAEDKPFAVGNVATAVAFVKWFLASAGVEPTGVSVLSRWPAEAPGQYRQWLNAGAASQVVVESLIRGCAEGRTIALAVQAGKLPG